MSARWTLGGGLFHLSTENRGHSPTFAEQTEARGMGHKRSLLLQLVPSGGSSGEGTAGGGLPSCHVLSCLNRAGDSGALGLLWAGGRAGGVRGQARHRVRAPGGQQPQPVDLCPPESGLWLFPLLQASCSSGGAKGRWARPKGSLYFQPRWETTPRRTLLLHAPSFPGESKQNVMCPPYRADDPAGRPTAAAMSAWIRAEHRTKPLLCGWGRS